MNEHHHHYGNLIVGAVDAELCHGGGFVGENPGEKDIADGLVHYSGYAKQEQGPGVGEHLTPQAQTEPPGGKGSLGGEEQDCDRR